MRAYDEIYLPDAMRNLAVMMDVGINRCGFPATLFFRMFISSGVAEQLAKGNPRFVTGYSGFELADTVIEQSTGKSVAANDGTYALSAEYWAGWVLAYYQWRIGKSFKYLAENGLDIEKVVSLYHPLHEADLEKFADVADDIISNHLKSSTNALKRARLNIGLTQMELSETSGVSLRMIRAYEQNSQEIANANFNTVSRLASALHIDMASIC